MNALEDRMPRYRCHKEVRALKIESIEGPVLKLSDSLSVDVGHEWIVTKAAEAGGYYVLYNDGYTSYSPAGAFEAGYTLVAE